VLLLPGSRYTKEGYVSAHPPSNIPFLALGAWILTVGWFGFNVMSAQTLDKVSGLVALNSLMAMVGGTLAAMVLGKNDPGFIHNGPLAGLVAVCAGSDLMHPVGALITGLIAGGLFVHLFTITQNRWKIDDVLGVWPLHGLCGAWGGLAAGIFGIQSLGGMGGVSFTAQLIGTLAAIVVALAGGTIVYGTLKTLVGIRLVPVEEFDGADLTIHKITATPDRRPTGKRACPRALPRWPQPPAPPVPSSGQAALSWGWGLPRWAGRRRDRARTAAPATGRPPETR
jgi:Amt family ammonium transporter